MRTILTEGRAAALARIALGHVERGPRALHPVFFGSLDRDSCVQDCWTLARLLGRFPAMAPAAEVRALFERRLTPEGVAGELRSLACPSARGFEQPCGWAWLLKLAAELRGFDDPWGVTLAPLADACADRFLAFLPAARGPVRSGTRFNSAFALGLARDYAVATAHDELLGLLWGRAVDWFGRDRDVRAGEPEGGSFLAPALVEAECMRRLLPAAEFHAWFDAFLPGVAAGEPAALFRPAAASDRADGAMAPFDGLNLSRAWCWRALASALGARDPRRAAMEEAAERHLAAALPHVADHDMGEHRLASFALLALDGPAPDAPT